MENMNDFIILNKKVEKLADNIGIELPQSEVVPS